MLRRFPIESKGRRKKLNEVFIQVNVSTQFDFSASLKSCNIDTSDLVTGFESGPFNFIMFENVDWVVQSIKLMSVDHVDIMAGAWDTFRRLKVGYIYFF